MKFTSITERSKNLAKFAKLCGNSSVGRAQPCQGWGRGFESRFPLNFIKVPAQVVKLVYTLLWGGSGRKAVWVRVSSCAQDFRDAFFKCISFFAFPLKKTQSKASKSTIRRRYGYPMKKHAKSMLKAWIKRRVKAERKGLKKRYKFVMIF